MRFNTSRNHHIQDNLGYNSSMDRLKNAKIEISTLYNKKWDMNLDTFNKTNIISSEKLIPGKESRFNTGLKKKFPKFQEHETSF
jgi:hypothetical protein